MDVEPEICKKCGVKIYYYGRSAILKSLTPAIKREMEEGKAVAVEYGCPSAVSDFLEDPRCPKCGASLIFG